MVILEFLKVFGLIILYTLPNSFLIQTFDVQLALNLVAELINIIFCVPRV